MHGTNQLTETDKSMENIMVFPLLLKGKTEIKAKTTLLRATTYMEIRVHA